MSQLPFAGLSSVEAADRLKTHGYNELPAAQRRGVFRTAFEVVRQPMFALLIPWIPRSAWPTF
jgi:P-type Ca2+ transporter type 2C